MSTGITSGAIAGVVIGVVVLLCCIGISIIIVVIAVRTGAYISVAASISSRINRRRNIATTTIPAATVVTSTGTKTDLGSTPPPPPYRPTQPQAAPVPYPQAAGNVYSESPQPCPAKQQPYYCPDDDKEQVELQDYPADPAQ